MNVLRQTIYGRIINYRMGPKSQTSRECLIEFETVSSASLASKLTGLKVIWKSGTKKFIGKVMGAHGRNGTVRVRFVHGVPGQAIGTLVELIN